VLWLFILQKVQRPTLFFLVIDVLVGKSCWIGHGDKFGGGWEHWRDCEFWVGHGVYWFLCLNCWKVHFLVQWVWSVLTFIRCFQVMGVSRLAVARAARSAMMIVKISWSLFSRFSMEQKQGQCIMDPLTEVIVDFGLSCRGISQG